MRTLGLLLLLAGTLGADVVVLKSGGRISGKVSEKLDHYEVLADGVLRTYLKEEVDHVVASPKEFVGDADQLVDDARADYQKALTLTDANPTLKAAIAKASRAREQYSAALELFPDDPALGKKIVVLMQLMRLLRERVHHEDVVRTPSATPAPVIRGDDALTVLLDPQLRADKAKRSDAIASFRTQKTDFATAAALFLSRGEPEGQVQDYFAQPFLKESLTPERHLVAAKFLAERQGKPGMALLQPFAIVHLSAAAPGPEVEKTAKTLGLLVQNGKVGTVEGHAVRDLCAWIAQGDFDLAVMAFVNEFRSIDTPAVRYVWSYALLRLVQARKRGFERATSALETVTSTSPGVPEHVAALVKSIRAVAVCNACLGEGKLRCTNCHGKKETKFICQRCKGKGQNMSSLGAPLVCPPCRGTGIDRIVKCEKCKDGWFDCKQCGKPRPAPSMEDIATPEACPGCDGRGTLFQNAAVPCRNCFGLGARLAPKADPARLLP